MNPEVLQQSITRLVESVQGAAARQAELRKSWTAPSTATTGLQGYDLEAPAKRLFPVITPLRNAMPRVKGAGGIATNWRAITGINTGGAYPGVPEGRRGSTVATSVKEYTAKYISLGLEDDVSWEADLAAMNFEDIKSVAVENLLRSLMIEEEKLILGGNASVALGSMAAGTITLTEGAQATGSITNGTYHVRIVPLTLAAYSRSSVAGGVPGQLDISPPDGGATYTIKGGAGQASADKTITTAGGATASIKVKFTPVAGAVAYAIFVGAVGGAAGAERLCAITTINSTVITAVPADPGADPAKGMMKLAGSFTADWSANTLVYDGLYSLIYGTNSGAVISTLADGNEGVGTYLTTDTAGGITQIDAVLRSFWDQYRLSPDTIYVAAQELNNITKLVIKNNGAPLVRFAMDQNGQQSPANLALTGGMVVGSYLNRFTMTGGQTIPISLHPNVAPGSILFVSHTLPYPVSNVPRVLQIKTRRDYYQLEWPIRARKYEYGVYCDSVLQCYAPFALGVVANIGDGVA